MIAIPTLLGGLAGFMIAQQTFNTERTFDQKERVEEVRAQSRMLADSLLEEIEALRAHAISYYQVRAGLDASIYHWAELSIQNLAPPAIRQSVTNPGWKNPAAPAILDNYLAAAIKQLNLSDLRIHGVSILRVKEDPQSQAEWIAFAFPVPGDSQGIVLALTEPSRVFTSIGRWSSRSEGGRLRGYLIGSDGYVLAHSNHSYIGADFSETPAFRGPLRAMLTGQRLNGIGDWQTVDQLPAMVSYLRLGSLPLGVVVERVISRDSGVAWKKIAGETLACLGALAILIGLEVWSLTRSKTATAPHSVIVTNTTTTATTTEVLDMPAEIPTIQISDDRLDEAIDTRTQASQAQMEERFLLSQFENEAPQIKDSRKLAVKLTLATSKIFRSPALFFRYHEGIQAAVLEAHAGFNEENKPAGMSCPIPETVLRTIFEREQQDPVVSLTNYGPLATLLNARNFEAWAVTGFAPEATPNGGGPRFLGILAILDQTSPGQGLGALTRLMKATGLSYENTLLS